MSKTRLKQTLIQFSVKNYRFIDDEAELQLAIDVGKELIDSNTFESDAKDANNLGLMKVLSN